jgi:WD40 repeat protein
LISNVLDAASQLTALSMSKQLGVIGTRAGEIVLLDDRTGGAPVLSMKRVHSKKVSDIDVDIDGTTVVSSGNDRFVKVFDVQKKTNGDCIHSRHDNIVVTKIAFEQIVAKTVVRDRTWRECLGSKIVTKCTIDCLHIV